MATDPAAGVVQNRAQYPHGAIGYGRRRDEGAVFVGGQVEALALAVIELHRAEQNV
jgi:hypothetical protein